MGELLSWPGITPGTPRRGFTRNHGAGCSLVWEKLSRSPANASEPNFSARLPFHSNEFDSEMPLDAPLAEKYVPPEKKHAADL
jgi:hypothetical protein